MSALLRCIWIAWVALASGCEPSATPHAHGERVRLQPKAFVHGERARTPHNAGIAALVGTAHAIEAAPSGHGLTGAGVQIGVWDEGHARTTHVDLRGRVRAGDLGGPSDHATHTTATLAGSGAGELDARGMATAARVWSYDWHLDTVEIESVAAGLSVSSNAYGPMLGWARAPGCRDRPMWWGGQGARRDAAFGRYAQDAAAVDALVRRTDLLLVWPAGNERLDTGAARGEPHYHEGACTDLFQDEHVQDTTLQFTTLGGPAVAKNVLTVGAARAVPPGALAPQHIAPMDVSSFGPTADGRIKPDLLAGGDRVRSAAATSDTAYATLAGSSSATAATAGAIALLTELYRRTHGGADPRAPELKALLVHAAREAGASPGPDYGAGYGLLDVSAAADLVVADGAVPVGARYLLVAAVTSDTPVVFSSADEVRSADALRFALAWSDPPAAHAGEPDGAALLVNDLDVMASVGEDEARFAPWSLDPRDPAAPATRDRPNRADTLELVDVDAAGHDGGRVRVEVRAARPLVRGEPQAFALVSSVPLVAADQPALALPRYVVLEVEPGQVVASTRVRLGHRGGEPLGLRARALAPFIAVTPEAAATPAELEIRVDASALALEGAAEAFGRVLIESDDPASPHVLGVIVRAVCEPDCEERACGSDPRCGLPCGRCAAGEACTEAGRCAAFAPSCPHAELGSDLGASLVSGVQRDATSAARASCGGAAARDHAFSFTAPQTGRYAFTTRGSDYDTVLYLRDSDCEGTELACNDDAGAVTSALAVELSAGESVTAVVDAFSAATDFASRFHLNVARATCPVAELGSRTGQAVAYGTTAGGVDMLAGSCGGEGSSDVALAWTAPRTGRYRFALFDPRFQSVLYLREGGCDGVELSCTVAADVGPIERELAAGERVSVVIDGREGQSGQFTLDVVDAEPGCADACGGAGSAGACFCDAACVEAGDCCADACERCGHCRCRPSCAGLACGSDGCGGSCGDCAPAEACAAGRCAPDACEGVRCGPCSACANGECRPLPEGAACEDGDLCTVLDACREGACTGEPRACDDGFACTRDRCDPETGACVFDPDRDCCDPASCRETGCLPGDPRCPAGARDGGVAQVDGGSGAGPSARAGGGGCGCRVAGDARVVVPRASIPAVLLLVAVGVNRTRRRARLREARRQNGELG